MICVFDLYRIKNLFIKNSNLISRIQKVPLYIYTFITKTISTLQKHKLFINLNKKTKNIKSIYLVYKNTKHIMKIFRKNFLCIAIIAIVVGLANGQSADDDEGEVGVPGYNHRYFSGTFCSIAIGYLDINFY